MVTEKISLLTEVIGSDDGKHTYEIKKTWNESGKKGLIIELYPTISTDKCITTDLSTLHLMNHVCDFGWGSVRIVNLYSTVFDSKPLTKWLRPDNENIAYIQEILESKDITDYDIVIAWGSSLDSNKRTNEYKLDILKTIKSKNLSKQVKHIISEYMDEETSPGVHPLFLGLHHARDKWSLKSFPVTNSVVELTKILNQKQTKKPKKKVRLEEKEDVHKNNEQT